MCLKHLAIVTSCYREVSEAGEGEVCGNAYQIQPPRVGFIPQILSEVKVVRVCVDESKWVRLS